MLPNLITFTRLVTTQQDEKEKRKAEVRARMEQAAASKKKRGFMTPARKKKLRV